VKGIPEVLDLDGWAWQARTSAVSGEIRALICRMSSENPGWRAPRIHGEVIKLGIDIGETSGSKSLVRSRKLPSQTWRAFLENHPESLISVEFFIVSAIRFQILTCSWCWRMSGYASFTLQ
jgi:hypothetical protein